MEHQGTVVTEMAGPATVLAVLQDFPSTFPVCLVYLLKLLLDKRKQEQNKYPSPVLSILAASSSPRLWEHFSLGPAPLSPHLTSAEVQGPAPLPRNAAGVPGYSWSQASYRAEALEPVSSDALLLTWGQSSRKGDRFRGAVVGPAEHRDMLFWRLSSALPPPRAPHAYRENCPSEVLDWHPWHIRLCLSNRSVREKH